MDRQMAVVTFGLSVVETHPIWRAKSLSLRCVFSGSVSLVVMLFMSDIIVLYFSFLQRRLEKKGCFWSQKVPFGPKKALFFLFGSCCVFGVYHKLLLSHICECMKKNQLKFFKEISL